MNPIRSALIVTDPPHPGYGTGQRVLALRSALSRLGPAKVILLTPHWRSPRPRGVDHLAPCAVPANPSRAFWVLSHLTFRELRPDARAQAAVRSILAEDPVDLVVCSFIRSTVAAPIGSVPCLLDVDCLPEPSGRVADVIMPITARLTARRAAQFSTAFVIRPSDAERLRPANTVLLPGISTTPSAPVDVRPDARNVLFVGSPHWPPNREAIELLVRRLAPALMEKRPRFVVRVVGQDTEQYTGLPGVSVGGFVDNIVDEYTKAAIVVCPIVSGGGANIKLAEALQLGAACVATDRAAAAYAGIAERGRHLLTAPTFDAFIDTVLEVLGDESRLEQLRTEARKLGSGMLSQHYFDGVVAAAARRALGRNEIDDGEHAA